jgi:hypothetical protein
MPRSSPGSHAGTGADLATLRPGPARPGIARARLPFLAGSVLALLAGLWAGLDRLGWALPPPTPSLPALHGPLMASGFLGTLIGLERAVALRRPWAYAVPALSGVSALGLAVGLPAQSAVLAVLASLGLVGVFAVVYRIQPALHTATMGAGAVAWLVAASLQAAGLPVFRSVPFWGAFLVLTITGERLELSRLGRLPRTGLIAYLGSAALYAAGVAVTAVRPDAGVRIAGVGMVALALWLFRYDIARRTVQIAGLPRFIAVSLLSGYLWLAVAGVLWGAVGGERAGLSYDAMLHALFLGFVVTMIFAHAPVIFPAVLGGPLLFHSRFYGHLVLLQGSLLLRVAGDMAGWLPGRLWGGLLNVLALLLFLANTALAAGAAGPSPGGDIGRRPVGE